METTTLNKAESNEMFQRAKNAIGEDMKARGFGAIIWDNSTAGFHQLPEIVHLSPEDGRESTIRITGLYLYNGEIYLMEEDKVDVSIDDFYDHDTEVKPTVVTLSTDMATKSLGNPDEQRGYTRQGTLEEWLVITDCYFEALTEM